MSCVFSWRRLDDAFTRPSVVVTGEAGLDLGETTPRRVWFRVTLVVEGSTADEV